MHYLTITPLVVATLGEVVCGPTWLSMLMQLCGVSVALYIYRYIYWKVVWKVHALLDNAKATLFTPLVVATLGEVVCGPTWLSMLMQLCCVSVALYIYRYIYWKVVWKVHALLDNAKATLFTPLVVATLGEVVCGPTWLSMLTRAEQQYISWALVALLLICCFDIVANIYVCT